MMSDSEKSRSKQGVARMRMRAITTHSDHGVGMGLLYSPSMGSRRQKTAGRGTGPRLILRVLRGGKRCALQLLEFLAMCVVLSILMMVFVVAATVPLDLGWRMVFWSPYLVILVVIWRRGLFPPHHPTLDLLDSFVGWLKHKDPVVPWANAPAHFTELGLLTWFLFLFYTVTIGMVAAASICAFFLIVLFVGIILDQRMRFVHRVTRECWDPLFLLWGETVAQARWTRSQVLLTGFLIWDRLRSLATSFSRWITPAEASFSRFTEAHLSPCAPWPGRVPAPLRL